MVADDLVARIAELEGRLQLVEDDRAIRELFARYGFNADMGRSEAFVSLYTEDGGIDISIDRRWEGHAGLMEFITSARGAVGRSMHALGNNLVTHINSNNAVAEGYSIILMREEDGVHVFSCSANRWTLEKIDGVWYIKERFIRSPGADGYDTVLSAEGYSDVLAGSESTDVR